MLKLTFPAQDSYVGLSRIISSGLARIEGLEDEEAYDLKLAVSEIVNILIQQNSVKSINFEAGMNNKEFSIIIKVLNGLDIENLLNKNLINKDMMGLLVDKVEISKNGNESSIRLAKFNNIA